MIQSTVSFLIRSASGRIPNPKFSWEKFQGILDIKTFRSHKGHFVNVQSIAFDDNGNAQVVYQETLGRHHYTTPFTKFVGKMKDSDGRMIKRFTPCSDLF